MSEQHLRLLVTLAQVASLLCPLPQILENARGDASIDSRRIDELGRLRVIVGALRCGFCAVIRNRGAIEQLLETGGGSKPYMASRRKRWIVAIREDKLLLLIDIELSQAGEIGGLIGEQAFDDDLNGCVKDCRDLMLGVSLINFVIRPIVERLGDQLDELSLLHSLFP